MIKPLRDLLVRQYHRFEGFDQQDSHEVLRCLLDGLRQEEVKRWQKAVLTALKINPKKAKAKVKAWGRSLNLCTAVDRIFGGVLLTSLTCCECNTVLSNFEIFLDLSLPIVEESTRNPPLHASSVSGPKRDQSERLVEVLQFCMNAPPHPTLASKTVAPLLGAVPNVFEKTPKSKRELKRERKAKAKQTRPKRKNKYSNFKGQGNIDSDFDDIVDVDTPPPDEADDIKVEVVQLPPEAEVRAPSASPENSTDGVLAAVANLPASGKEPTVAKTEEEAAMTWATTSYSPNSGQTEVLYDDLEITRRRIELLADAQNDFTGQESDVFEFKSAQSNPVSPIVPEGAVFLQSADEDSGNVNAGGDLADSEDNLADDEDEDERLLGCRHYCDRSNQNATSADVCELAAGFANVRLDEEATGISFSSPSEEAQAKSIAQCALSRSSSAAAASLTDLERCLARYTAPEMLSESNRIICETCTRRQHSGTSIKKPVLCRASKQDIIIRPPAVLTIHLKRFQQVDMLLFISVYFIRVYMPVHDMHLGTHF
ncbi:unnamed protein product [Schistocephalus solidus]|uniref:ubiquitinyl hydrolase 1 n=1 Tax=Schistocephalus solidus TaxID=70667 RepID=A0A183T3N5_SCHSO|nr:unnamed protein product [Schistocephalus solidus]